MDYVKPYVIKGFQNIRDRFVEMRVHHCLNSLDEVLDFDLDKSSSWESLEILDCSSNNIPRIDASMVWQL